MNKELILAALKAAGLSEDLVDQVTATSEEEMATQIAALKEKANKPTLASLLKDAGMDESLEDQIKATVGEMIQSETDRRVTSAIEKVTKKMSKGGTTEEGESEAMTALNKKIDSLTEALTGQQKSQEQSRLKTIAEGKLKEKGLPAKWLGRVNVEKEEDIETVITELETEFKEIKQATIDETLKSHPVPGFGLGTGLETSKGAIDKFVKTLDAEEKSGTVASLEPKAQD